MLLVKFPIDQKEKNRLKGNKDNNIGGFVIFAEQDYIAFRICSFLGFFTYPLFLMQQSIEKYLKALMILKGIVIPTKAYSGHSLTSLIDEIEKSGLVKDALLLSNEFRDWCVNLEPFNTAGRYPEEKLSAWVSGNNDNIKLMDDFIFRMRKLVRKKYERKILDPIEYIEKHQIIGNSVEAIKGSAEFLEQSFYHRNRYFHINRKNNV